MGGTRLHARTTSLDAATSALQLRDLLFFPTDQLVAALDRGLLDEDLLLECFDRGVVAHFLPLDFVLGGFAEEIGLLGFQGGEFLRGGRSGGGGVGPEALGELPVFGQVVDLSVL